MKVSKMIEELQKIQVKYGDLTIVGGYILDDSIPRKLTVINDEGYDVIEYGGEPVGVFIE